MIKRNGALIACGMRPFTEFAGFNNKGEAISPEDVIDGAWARKELQTVGDDEDYYPFAVMPADRDSLRLFGRKTITEWVEEAECARLLDVLQHDRSTFDNVLTKTISLQRGVVVQMGMDADEAEVLAAITLLWAVGARTYLNFLDETNRKRIRNGWDRFNRRLKSLQWATLLRKTLRVEARKRRNPSWAEQLPQKEVVAPDMSQPRLGSRGGFGIPAEVTLRWHSQMDKAAGLLFPPSKETLSDSQNGARVVDLGCDLSMNLRALYRSSARKPKPRWKTKLYSE